MTAYRDPTNQLSGIGFVFAEEGPYAGVDFDNCLGPEESILPWAKPWLDRLVGYAEISPSGKGVKAFIYGEVPGGKGRKLTKQGPGGLGAIEVYDRGRFFTVTSRSLDDRHAHIGNGGAELAGLHAEWFPPKSKPPQSPKPAKLTKSDHEIIALIESSKQGSKFSAYWHGSTEGHQSGSEADLALCSILAWWTQGDSETVDRLFRQSGLYRPDKWDRPSYREPTLDKACNLSSFYDPNHGRGGNGYRIRHPDDEPVEESEQLSSQELSPFGNHHPEGGGTEESGKVRIIPHNIHQIDENWRRQMGGWPKRVGERLFIASDLGEPVYLNTPARLFSWIDGRSHVNWTKGARFITQDRFYEHLRMEEADRFDSIEVMPHVPPFPRAYYMHPPLPAPSGKLDELLDRFLPSTPADRSLIAALILTPLWGGEPGTRPAFLITGPDYDEGQGRGLGKTTLVDLVADVLYQGSIGVTANEDMADIKTRMLSPEGETKRIARLDNVKSLRFSWGDLEDMITASNVSGRVLYQGNGSRRNDITWTITLNGASLSKDMAERVVTIKLGRPSKNRDARWRDDTVSFMQTHRWAILADAAAILAAEPGSLRPATRWASWEAGILSKLPLAAECQAAMIERQDYVDEGNSDRDLVRGAIVDAIIKSGREPAECILQFTSKTMAEVISEATRKHYETATATTFVKGLSIPELIQVRKNNFRGWIWAGLRSTEVEPELFQPVTPLSHR